ncbi:hypothetical protein T492DRAFT_258327 [Pavlovales sp. CCMP2436]|nr:hypothetical protein T492DRAFT_258327 [Pavlovales sp. CCMP2436]
MNIVHEYMAAPKPRRRTQRFSAPFCDRTPVRCGAQFIVRPSEFNCSQTDRAQLWRRARRRSGGGLGRGLGEAGSAAAGSRRLLRDGARVLKSFVRSGPRKSSRRSKNSATRAAAGALEAALAAASAEPASAEPASAEPAVAEPASAAEPAAIAVRGRSPSLVRGSERRAQPRAHARAKVVYA